MTKITSKATYDESTQSPHIEQTLKNQPNYALSALEEDILTVLMSQPAYGLQISKAIETASYGTRKIGMGSLYPSLRRLEDKGFVTSHWDTNESPEEERSGARRRYYQISSTGSKVLLENRDIRENLLQWQPV